MEHRHVVCTHAPFKLASDYFFLVYNIQHDLSNTERTTTFHRWKQLI